MADHDTSSAPDIASSEAGASSSESTAGDPSAPSSALFPVPATRTGRLRRLLVATVQKHMPRPDEEAEAVEEPPRRTGSYARWLPILRAVPWILLGVFGTSFVWDFPGAELTVWGHTITVEGLLRITSVSGLIGFLTNWLALTMLFQPREPRPLVGQGVIPAQRERVAWRLAQAVSDELINEEIIIEKIHDSDLTSRYRDLALSITRDVTEDPVFRAELKTLLEDYFREVLSSPEVRERIVDFTEAQIEKNVGEGLPGLALRVYRTVGEEAFQKRLDEAVGQLPDAVGPILDEAMPYLDHVPEQLERRADEIEVLLTQLVLRFVESINIQKIVLDNVRAYDERQLENLLKRTTNEQLNYIKYLGGVLGVIGGLVIWAPVASLIGLAILVPGVWAMDEALFRMQGGE
ncbi:DUF445 domain-containing protein [Longibacter salinarum]|uniref:DUF445 domain-containing protein n=1 Tax=Longibacter salinarum TaxID=1850348 RepID=A0A2A8CZT4_9BACT|nr:DUF445 family protein [Longibacter salinarum]PEN14212.1 DUF445 domain-containing protein [Longibacter salinarum]